MEENNVAKFIRIDENPEHPGSPFHGTPWSSDEEIYDFVIYRKYSAHENWAEIMYDLTIRGLDATYADEIIENVRAEWKKAGTAIRLKAFGECISGLALLGLGFYHSFISPDRTLTANGFVACYGGGLVLVIDGIRRLVRNYS